MSAHLSLPEPEQPVVDPFPVGRALGAVGLVGFLLLALDGTAYALSARTSGVAITVGVAVLAGIAVAVALLLRRDALHVPPTSDHVEAAVGAPSPAPVSPWR